MRRLTLSLCLLTAACASPLAPTLTTASAAVTLTAEAGVRLRATVPGLAPLTIDCRASAVACLWTGAVSVPIPSPPFVVQLAPDRGCATWAATIGAQRMSGAACAVATAVRP